MAWTAANITAVEKLAMSQENPPGTHRTTHQIARDIGITRSSVHEIICWDLKLKCFNRDEHRIKRLICAKQLLKRFPVMRKLLPVNLQNDRVYAVCMDWNKKEACTHHTTPTYRYPVKSLEYIVHFFTR